MGAGIIIVKYENGLPLFLGLEARKNDQIKHGGKYDLPKGTQDPGEDFLTTAIRETMEETGIIINPDKLLDGPKHSQALAMWLAIVPNGTRVILDKGTDEKLPEHLGYDWLTFSEIYPNSFVWLRPFIKWAHTRLKN